MINKINQAIVIMAVCLIGLAHQKYDPYKMKDRVESSPLMNLEGIQNTYQKRTYKYGTNEKECTYPGAYKYRPPIYAEKPYPWAPGDPRIFQYYGPGQEKEYFAAVGESYTYVPWYWTNTAGVQEYTVDYSTAHFTFYADGVGYTPYWNYKYETYQGVGCEECKYMPTSRWWLWFFILVPLWCCCCLAKGALESRRLARQESK